MTKGKLKKFKKAEKEYKEMLKKGELSEEEYEVYISDFIRDL